MYLSRVLILALAIVTAVAARADAQGAAAPAPADIVTVDGTVVAVDAGARQLTIKTADGTTMVTTVGPQVTNLANLKAGDRVVVKQIVPVVVSASRPSAAAATAPAPQASGAATPGAKSARASVDTEEVTATVQSVDVAAHTVVLRASDGTLRTVKIGPNVQLDQVAVGDQATLRITRATAVAVDNAPVR